MDRLSRLEAIEEIRHLKARYFRFMDCKLWDQLPSVFTADMRVITPDGRIWIEGGSNYAASLASTLQNAISCHQGLTAEIDILDANHATGIWAMQDVIEWRDRHPREGWKSILGRGHYHETYQREDGAWRIATLSLARLRLDIVWPDNPGIGEAHAREV
jgi:SnoaL-like domain